MKLKKYFLINIKNSMESGWITISNFRRIIWWWYNLRRKWKEGEKDENNNNDDINTNKNRKNYGNNNYNGRSIVLFYNIKGELIKKVCVPLSREFFLLGVCSTLALAAENYIYLAFVKYKYKWIKSNNTIVFGYPISDKKYNFIFSDIINNNKQDKLVYILIDILSSDYLCAIIEEREENQFSFMIMKKFYFWNMFCKILSY